MSGASDLIDSWIPVLRTGHMPATLVATAGFHCDVWRAAGSIVRDDGRHPLDLVIKVPREPCETREVRAIRRQHERLRAELGDIVPPTLFVAAAVNGAPSALALAPAVKRWFDVANPAHEAECLPLLQRIERARNDLTRFVRAAERWDRDQQLVVDLYGLDNLVLDTDRRLRYVDSFWVFFCADLLHAIDPADGALAERIALSRRRLDYLRYLIDASAPAG